MVKNAHVFWFTGLSGVGKSTLAEVVQNRLKKKGLKVLVFDGDVIRSMRHKHLGFTPPEIKTNNALIAELCANNRAHYDAILVPIISPYDESRTNARRFLGKGFHEIYIVTKFSLLEDRDPKGLYARARKGEIDNLIGVSSRNIYEVPKNPNLTIDTSNQAVEKSADRLYKYCMDHIQCNRCNSYA